MSESVPLIITDVLCIVSVSDSARPRCGHPLPHVYESEEYYRRWSPCPTSWRSARIFGGMGRTVCFIDHCGLPVVFRYLRDGRKVQATDLSWFSSNMVTPRPQNFRERILPIGSICYFLRLGDLSRIAERPPPSSHIEHVDLFFATLRVGFRLAKPGNYQMVLYLKQVPHLDYMFETAFSSYDHEIIADAVSVWGTGDVHLPPGSLVRCCIKCVEWTTPFSPRLRRVSVGRSSSSRIVSSTRQGRRLFGC